MQKLEVEFVQKDLELELARACSLAMDYAMMLSVPSSNALYQLEAVRGYLEVCRREFVRGNAESIAREDAAGCIADEEVLNVSKYALQRCGSIEAVIREVQLKEQHGGFNEDRCRACFSDYDEYDKLMEIARIGASVPLPDGFQINHVQPARRQLDVRLGNTYLRHAMKHSKSGKMVLFRIEGIPPGEFDKLHWTAPLWGPKPDVAHQHGFNPSGRFSLT